MTQQRFGSFWFKFLAGIAAAAVCDLALWGLDKTLERVGVLQLALLMAVMLVRPEIRRDARALACFAGAAAMAFAMIVSPSALAWCLYWVFAGMGAMMPAAARFGDAWQWAQRLLLHALRSPFAPWLDARRWLRARRRHGGGQLRAALPQLVLPLLGSVVILTLFASANPVIEAWADSLTYASPSGELILRAILGLVWFTIAWSVLRPRMARRLIGTFDGSGDVTLPGVTPASVGLSLIAFNALFALQNAMDLAWLWHLAPLPRGMTLAEYAHRGAYPLIATALLAAGFVLVALRPGSQTADMPMVRRLVVLWIAQNVLLVGNAALRTMDYVAAYSLTSLRIAALLWMGLVALGLVLVLWRMLREKSAAWLINTNAAAAMALLSLVSFVDLDAVSARYNIAHARDLGGDGAPLDICYLQQIGSSALVPLAKLEGRPAPEPIHLWARMLRENAQVGVENDQANGRWSLLGAMRLAQVRSQLRLAALAPRDHGWVDCRTRDAKALQLALWAQQANPAAPLPAALTEDAQP